jgi:hypothetical protein
METTKNRNTLVVDLLNTAAVFAVLVAVFLTWRTVVGQDNGVVRLLGHIF